MYQDDYGLPVTAVNSDAAGHLSKAIGSFVNWNLDFMDHVNRAMEVESELPMAHLLKGLVLAGGRHVQYRPVIENSIQVAKAAGSDINARERLYLRALEQILAGQLNDACDSYRKVLAEHPTDLLTHRLVQQELFWMGQAGQMHEVVEAAAPAWSADTPGWSMFNSVRAFSNEEALNYDDAERYGRAGVEMDPTDTWGAHAIAHVLVMQGRIDDGVAWLEGLTDNWAGKNQIVHHLWWHLCLFLLETGEHDRILSHYDREVRNPDSPMVQAVPDAYIDVQNAASLLVRLELRGVDVGERWTPLAEVAEGRIDNHVNPFTSAHAAIILAANGMYERATDLVRSMQEFAVEDDGPLGAAMAQAAIPASLASIAHRKGDHGEVVAQLMPARHHVPLMGGSHAQRDVFFQILMDSCRKLGDSGEVQTLIEEITRIGFAEVPQRTLYADAAALVA